MLRRRSSRGTRTARGLGVTGTPGSLDPWRKTPARTFEAGPIERAGLVPRNVKGRLFDSLRSDLLSRYRSVRAAFDEAGGSTLGAAARLEGSLAGARKVFAPTISLARTVNPNIDVTDVLPLKVKRRVATCAAGGTTNLPALALGGLPLLGVPGDVPNPFRWS